MPASLSSDDQSHPSISVDEQNGLSVLTRCLKPADWIIRKEEDLVLVDYQTLQRNVRLDVALHEQSRAGDSALPAAEEILPIALFPRSKFGSVTVRDGSGNLLPRFDKRLERSLAESGLYVLMLSEVYLAPGPRIENERGALRALARAIVTEDSEVEVGRLISRYPSIAFRVRGSATVLTAAQLLHQYYMCLTAVDVARTRVIVYQVIDPLPHAEKGRRSLIDWVWPSGVIAQDIQLGDTPYGTRSYHVQVSNPYDLYFSDVSLTYEVQSLDQKDNSWTQHTVPDKDMIPTRAHVHLAGGLRAREAWLRLKMAHSPTGLVRSAPMSAWFTFIILASCTFLVWSQRREPDAQVSTSVILLMLSFSGALIAAPKVHDFTARALFPTRLLVMMSSFSPIIPAIYLSFASRPGDSRPSGQDVDVIGLGAWGAASAISLVAAILLLLQFIILRRRWNRVGSGVRSED